MFVEQDVEVTPKWVGSALLACFLLMIAEGLLATTPRRLPPPGSVGEWGNPSDILTGTRRLSVDLSPQFVRSRAQSSEVLHFCTFMSLW